EDGKNRDDNVVKTHLTLAPLHQTIPQLNVYLHVQPLVAACCASGSKPRKCTAVSPTGPTFAKASLWQTGEIPSGRGPLCNAPTLRLPTVSLRSFPWVATA